MKLLLIYTVLFFVPAYSMQQFSPSIPHQQALESLLSIKITSESDRLAIAKQIVPSMQRLIDNNVPKASEVERTVLLLQMLDRLLPGKKLALDN